MTKEELLLLQVSRVMRSAQELTETKNWKDKLSRLKELKSYWAECEATFTGVENVIKRECNKTLSWRAVEKFWRDYPRHSQVK